MERFKALYLRLKKNEIIFYTVLLCFCLFMACLSYDYDYDLFARLMVGDSFINHGIIHYQDLYSYTPTHLWFDHEWGASQFFYVFFKLFGNFGLILIQALLIFGTTFFVLKTQKIQKNAYPCTMGFTVLFLYFLCHLNPSIVRCHMFSFMFFSMFLYILEKHRRFNSNLIWLIPPIVLIWNNIHGGVVSGLGIVFIYLLSAILTKKQWKKYLYVLLISTFLLGINPYGTDYYSFLLSANTKTRNMITEWWGVFVQRHVVYYYPAFCVAIVTVITCGIKLLSKKKIELTKLLLLVTTATLGIIHVKLLSLTIIVISGLFYKDLMLLFKKNFVKNFEKIIFPLVCISILFIPMLHPSESKISHKFPIEEVEFIKQNKISGNILTPFGLGSYVSYKLYPQNLIYMDGRYEEVYYDREFDNLIAFENGLANWQSVYLDYPTEILMPLKAMPTYKEIEKSGLWIKIYEGPICGVFVKKGTEKRNYIKPPQNIEYYKETTFDNFGSFYK